MCVRWVSVCVFGLNLNCSISWLSSKCDVACSCFASVLIWICFRFILLLPLTLTSISFALSTILFHHDYYYNYTNNKLVLLHFRFRRLFGFLPLLLRLLLLKMNKKLLQRDKTTIIRIRVIPIFQAWFEPSSSNSISSAFSVFFTRAHVHFLLS